MAVGQYPAAWQNLTAMCRHDSSETHCIFSGQTRELQPLTAARLADELGVHPSTVSRALQGKHLQCRFGVFPLQYFCTGSVADNALSRQAIESRIALFIQMKILITPQ